MKKIFLFLFLLIAGTTLSLKSYAGTPYLKLIRNDGMEIYKCAYGNGVIDYCTAYDRNNAEVTANNPARYQIIREEQVEIPTYQPTITKHMKNTTFGETCTNIQYSVSTATTTLSGIKSAIQMLRSPW